MQAVKELLDRLIASRHNSSALPFVEVYLPSVKGCAGPALQSK
jgi:hypothetical protein